MCKIFAPQTTTHPRPLVAHLLCLVIPDSLSRTGESCPLTFSGSRRQPSPRLPPCIATRQDPSWLGFPRSAKLAYHQQWTASRRRPRPPSFCGGSIQSIVSLQAPKKEAFCPGVNTKPREGHRPSASGPAPSSLLPSRPQATKSGFLKFPLASPMAAPCPPQMAKVWRRASLFVSLD